MKKIYYDKMKKYLSNCLDGDIDGLFESLDYYDDKFNLSMYHKGFKFAEDGGFDSYITEMRRLLRDVYAGTEYENIQYSDKQVVKQYCHLFGQTIEKLAKERGYDDNN